MMVLKFHLALLYRRLLVGLDEAADCLVEEALLLARLQQSAGRVKSVHMGVPVGAKLFMSK